MTKSLPIITLITPCFNGAQHIGPYLEGVLAQTYRNVQYIFVNDGSTDETEKIILAAKNKIEAKGWKFLYIKQENAGQSAAMNNALPRIKGKYFSQIDSDDIIHPEYLQKYCEFLETHDDCKFCYARVNIVEDKNPEEVIKTKYRKIEYGEQDNLFNDLIMETNVPPLAFYMINTKAFLSAVKLPIFEGKGGQNWQILLPMAYKYKCGYIDDTLATCIVREDSHSHALHANRENELKQILFDTVSKIDMSEGERIFWYDKIISKYLKVEQNKMKFLLFGFIPFLKIKHKQVYLFGFIKIGKIKIN